MNNFEVRDSGHRQEYKSGMVRDTQEGKPQYRRLFYGPLATRLANHLTKGAAKYPDDADGTPNWMHANSQEERIRFVDSAARHFAEWLEGMLFNRPMPEDYFAAVVFNMNAAEYVMERLRQKPKALTPQEFNGQEIVVPDKELPF
jgi:hypothetical protein